MFRYAQHDNAFHWFHANRCHSQLITLNFELITRRAAQVFAADNICLAGALMAPQRQLGLVDPLVAVDPDIAGPQAGGIGAPVDADQPAVAQPYRRAGLAVQPGRARQPKAAAIVGRDRVVDGAVDAIAQIVRPADRQQPAAAHIDDLLLPVDHLLGRAVHDLDIFGPGLAAIV